MHLRNTLILFSISASIIVAACWPGEPQISPAYAQESDLYINPLPVEIAGYTGSAMEPFISLDGNFLFFNSDADSPTKNRLLHFARRTGPLSFRYLGELPGV